jgi:uncharacterized protein YjdB
MRFKSSDPKVVGVRAFTGRLSPVKAGKAVITVTALTPGKDGKKVTTSFTVTVAKKAAKVKKVSASVPKKLKVGKSVQVLPKWAPNKATLTNLYVKSSNAKVATVDRIGTVKAVKAGKVKITVRVNNKKKVYTVRVVK